MLELLVYLLSHWLLCEAQAYERRYVGVTRTLPQALLCVRRLEHLVYAPC